MKFSFHPDARIELQQSVDYYEEQQPELGLEFLEEVYSTIHRIVEFPKAWSRYSKNTRKCLTSRFPFEIKVNEIFIVAVAHFARKPGYWKERLVQNKVS